MKSLFPDKLSKAVLLAVLAAVGAGGSAAQESTSAPPASAQSSVVGSAVDGPSAVLRDALSAACAESQSDFSRFLTARNQETYLYLLPTIRVALMKRFVLMSEPGKATVTANPGGRPVVRCETPAGADEIQIGGADIADNLAFLPVEVRNASEPGNEDIAHVQMGLVRENGQWKLLSVGVIFLDLPSLAAEWESEQIGATEKMAVATMKTISEALETYRRTYTRLPDSLTKLAPPLQGVPTADAAALLTREVASGQIDGYKFRYVIVGASDLGAPAKYELAATPIIYGQNGLRSFFRDSSGGLHGADHRGAVGSATDPLVE